MEKPLRLHLGAGDKYWPGWINLDADTDLLNLPYESVDEIHAIHLFEHFWRSESPLYLVHWFEILKEGGKLVLEMPSMDKIAQMIVDGEQEPRMTLLGIFGDERTNNPLMLHHWCYTEAELTFLLTKAGFKVEFMEPVFHYAVRDLRVEAVKWTEKT